MISTLKSNDKLKATIQYEKKIYLLSEQTSTLIKKSLITRFQLLRKSSKEATIIHLLLCEMIVNAIKATHKKIYHKYIVKELQNFLSCDEIAYTKWLQLFVEEIEIHQYKNLHYFTKKEKKYITIQFIHQKSGFLMSTQNFGIPSKIEARQILKSLETSEGASDLAHIFAQNTETSLNEGAGLGIGLILMTLHQLGIRAENFSIKWENKKTTASLNLPWSFFD